MLYYQEGYDAFYRGDETETNPYDENDQRHDEWEKGYLDADAQESGEWEPNKEEG